MSATNLSLKGVSAQGQLGEQVYIEALHACNTLFNVGSLMSGLPYAILAASFGLNIFNYYIS